MVGPREAQEICLMVAHALCPICLALTVWWVNGSDLSALFLGGLDWSGSPPAYAFNWHPLMMVCGVIAETQALLSFRTWPLSPNMLKLIHLFWHLVSGVLFAIGLAAVWRYQDMKVEANLYSLHSWIGIAIITLFYAQQFLGFAAFIFPVASPIWRRAYLPLYVFFGGFIYAALSMQVVLGLVNKTVDQGCGYNKHWSYNEPDTNPAEHFDSIYLGCRVGYGIGITVTVISMCALYATTDLASAVGLDKKDGKDEPRYQRIEMSSDVDAGLNESDAVL